MCAFCCARFGHSLDSKLNDAKQKLHKKKRKNLRTFLYPEENPKVKFTVFSLEFGTACGDLQWNHCGSTPHRPDPSGIAESAVRRVTEGSSSISLKSGLDQQWWAESMECSYGMFLLCTQCTTSSIR